MLRYCYYLIAELSQVTAWAFGLFLLLELLKPRLVLAHLNLSGFFIFWLITAMISLVLNYFSLRAKS